MARHLDYYPPMPATSTLTVAHPRVIPMSDSTDLDPNDILWLRSAGLDPDTITDDELPASVQYARDIQEANSRKYGAAIVILMPLSSGNFAAFPVDRQDVKILSPDDLGDSTIINKLVHHYTESVRERTAHITRLSEVGIREPDGRTIARDLRAASRPTTHRRTNSGPAVEIDMDEL